MTTPATITTEELDALRDEYINAIDFPQNYTCAESTDRHARFHETICAAAPRLIEQARRAIEYDGALSRILPPEDAEGSPYNVTFQHYLDGVNDYIRERTRAESTESALSATRERLELAVEALRQYTELNCDTCSGELAEEALSAIAAKACTGGKGEGK